MYHVSSMLVGIMRDYQEVVIDVIHDICDRCDTRHIMRLYQEVVISHLVSCVSIISCIMRDYQEQVLGCVTSKTSNRHA